MKMGILYFLVTLLVSLAHVNARNIFLIESAGKSMLEYGDSLHGPVVVDLTPEEEVPSLEVLPPDFICHSCLKVSRKAEEILTDPMLLEKAGEISTEVCQILPSDLQVKCLDMSETYTHQAILFLQEYFREENLCNSTGLCTGDTETPSAKGVVRQSGTQSWLLTLMHLHRFTNQVKGGNIQHAVSYLLRLVSYDVGNIQHAVSYLLTLVSYDAGLPFGDQNCLYGGINVANVRSVGFACVSQKYCGKLQEISETLGKL